MRIEQAHLFLLGFLLYAMVWLISRRMAVGRTRNQMRAIAFAGLLGSIVVPGHGEVIVAPILAVAFSPWRPQTCVLGGAYFVLWWVIASLHFRKSGHPDA